MLLYTRTTAYRHDSIPDAVDAVGALGEFEADHTEDPAVLEGPLAPYAAVVFLSTSGEVLTPAGRTRLAEYVEAGGGFVGVHAAACTEDDWPYYGELLGARFDRHPRPPAGPGARRGPRPPPRPGTCPPSGSSRTSGTTSVPIRAARSGPRPRRRVVVRGRRHGR